jgi:deoxyadenosine/deoxycytidine kinase
MSDIAILNEMIKQVATVPLIDHKNQKKVILEEKEDNPDLKKELNKKANYSIECGLFFQMFRLWKEYAANNYLQWKAR